MGLLLASHDRRIKPKSILETLFRQSAPVPDDSFFAPAVSSVCIDTTRRRLGLQLDAGPDLPLTTMAFATRTGSSSEGWWALRAVESRAAAGELSWRRFTGRWDSVEACCCVHLCTGAVLESVELASEPRVARLFVQGASLGRLVEETLPPETTWWKRIFTPRRAWQVYLHDTPIGRIDMQYPISKKSRLMLQLDSGPALPIGLASRWGQPSTSLVIPPDTPEVDNKDLANLHFLLVVYFRTLFALDFSSS
jgi:hypothetical protein